MASASCASRLPVWDGRPSRVWGTAAITSMPSGTLREEMGSSGTSSPAGSNRAVPLEVPRMSGGERRVVQGLGPRRRTSGSSAPAGPCCTGRGDLLSGSSPAWTGKTTLFTVHGDGDRVLAVGGGSNGVVLDGRRRGLPATRPRRGSALPRRVRDDRGDWASGARGTFTPARARPGPLLPRSIRLGLPATSSLHSIYRGRRRRVVRGGNVLRPALDGNVDRLRGARLDGHSGRRGRRCPVPIAFGERRARSPTRAAGSRTETAGRCSTATKAQGSPGGGVHSSMA